jgi:FXSXX-COOH protein
MDMPVGGKSETDAKVGWRRCRDVTEEETPGDEETFSSDVIDLSAVDLTTLDRLPSPVLHASLRRLLRELAEGDEASAYFQSSLRDNSRREELP